MIAVWLVLVCTVACNLQLNAKYRDVLHGRKMLTEAVALQIYSEFVSVYSQKSSDRFEVFQATLHEIRQHNLKRSSWTQGINDYSDLTFREFSEMLLMAPQNCSATYNLKVRDSFRNVKAPDSFEWNSFGVVTPVKNQGSCGSCWSFSAVGAIESHWNILGKGKNLTLSEQQLIDCSGMFGNLKCNGGLPSQAFEYVQAAEGIESNITYPYTAKNGSCVYRLLNAVAYVNYGSYNITRGDEKELAERLYVVGPVSIAFQVIDGFKNYASGVYSVENCGTASSDINHAVLATGYGTENGKKFWNVKNSWGATWGNKGYFKIERDVNMCAVAQCNSYPLIDRPASQGLEEVEK